ncbi:hypothetical protein B0T16DRAFT_414282, partial [Cercophora newfieldiana]
MRNIEYASDGERTGGVERDHHATIDQREREQHWDQGRERKRLMNSFEEANSGATRDRRENPRVSFDLRNVESATKETEAKETDADQEYYRRLRADLHRSGLSEEEIDDLIRKSKAKRTDGKQDKAQQGKQEYGGTQQPNYTRISLRHLDIETLVFYRIDFEYDQEPGYVLIKRWLPEWEHEMLWEHTQKTRLMSQRSKERAKGGHKVYIDLD